MTLRDLQYATQDLIDSGAVKDTDEVAVRVMADKVCLYVQTEDEMVHLATLTDCFMD